MDKHGSCIFFDYRICSRCYSCCSISSFFKNLKDEQKVRRRRTRSQPIRTLSLMPVKIKITMTEAIPLYKKLAPKIKELKTLGMTNEEIATRLKICRKTIRKAFAF